MSLLSTKGIDNRIRELEKFIEEYKKNSHREALESAKNLKKQVYNFSIETKDFQFDILSDMDLPKEINNIDIVITDLPYGKLTSWSGLKDQGNPVQMFLDKIRNRLNKNSIVAIVLNKKQEISHKGFTKIKSLKFVKRKVFLLEPIN